jgi:hypothetical protein
MNLPAAVRSPRTLLIALALAGALLAALAGSGTARGGIVAPKPCPDSFRVLHNDHIGKLSLRKGHYTITILSGNLSCSKASKLFTNFLEDYDGNLSHGWKVNARKSQFKRRNGDAFGVKRGTKTGHGGGKHPDGGGKICPGTFTVQHNDRIGKVKFPAGQYTITRLTRNSPSCARATKKFASFLQDYDGNLPKNWRLNSRKAAFFKRHTGGAGFRVKQA